MRTTRRRLFQALAAAPAVAAVERPQPKRFAPRITVRSTGPVSLSFDASGDVTRIHVTNLSEKQIQVRARVEYEFIAGSAAPG